jgi:signal transduction histidine kinase
MGAALSAALARQDELEEQRRLFIGAIAHDLRTPLFTLRAHLAGLRDGLAGAPDKAASYVEVCCEKADALERLIADLFTYTRVEYLEEAPRSERLELGALLQQTVAGLRPQAAAKGVTLAVRGQDQPAALAGDRQLLTRVIENLLDNALRHTPAGGRIGVAWRQEATAAYFTVEDSGPGIAAHDLPHLFTPLYRGEASRNRQTGGAGLGLAIARRIMQAHGGDLIAANGSSGGAVFTGWLPIDRRVPALPVPVHRDTAEQESSTALGFP